MRIRLFLLLFLSYLGLTAQDFSEDWTGHFSYGRVSDLSIGNGRVYAASENAVFIFSAIDGTLQTRTTINGLSGNTISSIYYSEAFDTLFIGYENGIMDVIVANSANVLTVVDIFNKPSITPNRKQINGFIENNGFVYISTGFGISLFDLGQLEFDDSYFIGDGGGLLDIQATAILGDYIYASSTDGGVRRALVANDNLIDFNNWETVLTGSYGEIVNYDNTLYLIQGSDILKSEDGINFIPFNSYPQGVTDLRVASDTLLVIYQGNVLQYDSSGTLTQTTSNIEGFTDRYSTAVILNGNIYISTVGSGVAQLMGNSTVDINRILPNGPAENEHFNIKASAGNIWSVFGDYDVFYNPFPLKTQGISHFIEGELWENINPGTLFGAQNLVHIAINPLDAGQLYVSSFNDGLLELIDGVPSIIYDQNNSSFLPVPGTTDDVRISGGAFDASSNFWVTNSRVPSAALHRVSPGGQFTAINTSEALPDNIGGYSDLVIAGDGKIYFGSDNAGVIGYDPSSSQFTRFFGEDGAANLPIDDIRSLAIDRNESLWIGTRLGLRILFNPSQIFEDPFASSNAIIILQDGIAQELLNDQVITSIIVDGRNNKWIGTADSGAFYISPSGQETIFHFTKDNSPLPSNTVQSIAIDPQTGSVYIGTVQGLVAFNGSSIAPAEDLENVIIYPNPVRPGFSGNVRIEGLTARTNVKITDLVGNLVYEENTQGGSIEWDTTAFGRHKVASGVYLLLITGPPDQDGQETQVEKLMIIR